MKAQLLSLGLALSIAGSVQAAELPQQAYLNLETAQELASVALSTCAADGYSVRFSG